MPEAYSIEINDEFNSEVFLSQFTFLIQRWNEKGDYPKIKYSQAVSQVRFDDLEDQPQGPYQPKDDSIVLLYELVKMEKSAPLEIMPEYEHDNPRI